MEVNDGCHIRKQNEDGGHSALIDRSTGVLLQPLQSRIRPLLWEHGTILNREDFTLADAAVHKLMGPATRAPWRRR
jgi:hypothetical protein